MGTGSEGQVEHPEEAAGVTAAGGGSLRVLKNTRSQAVCALSQMCLRSSGRMANKRNSAHRFLLCAQFPAIQSLKCCILY